MSIVIATYTTTRSTPSPSKIFFQDVILMCLFLSLLFIPPTYIYRIIFCQKKIIDIFYSFREVVRISGILNLSELVQVVISKFQLHQVLVLTYLYFYFTSFLKIFCFFRNTLAKYTFHDSTSCSIAPCG